MFGYICSASLGPLPPPTLRTAKVEQDQETGSKLAPLSETRCLLEDLAHATLQGPSTNLLSPRISPIHIEDLLPRIPHELFWDPESCSFPKLPSPSPLTSPQKPPSKILRTFANPTPDTHTEPQATAKEQTHRIPRPPDFLGGQSLEPPCWEKRMVQFPVQRSRWPAGELELSTSRTWSPREVAIWGKARGGTAEGSGHPSFLPDDRSPPLLTPAHRAASPPGWLLPSRPPPLPPLPPSTPGQNSGISLQTCQVPCLSPSSPYPALLAALAKGLPPRNPYPNPSSLQSRCSLPSIGTSRSKGPSRARNCDTEPQPAFPASLLLPCLWEEAKKLSPLALGFSQPGRNPGVQRGRCWAFQGVSESGCPAGATDKRGGQESLW